MSQPCPTKIDIPQPEMRICGKTTLGDEKEIRQQY